MVFEIREPASWLKPEDLKHLIAAQGYAELDMIQDANAEMNEIDPDARHVLGILAIFTEIRRVLEAAQTQADSPSGS